MTIDESIALLSSIGACSAAVATFLTVLPISKHRKATYRPELALPTIRFRATADPTEKQTGLYFWEPADDVAAADLTAKSNRISSTFSIPIANIGLGAAKDVAVTW